MKILVVEDEEKLAELVQNRLVMDNHEVDIALDGEDGLYKGMTDIYDLIILDVMLPYRDGFSILKELKENNIKSKIIMLTARSDIEDKLNGLTNGADDYITKPFHLDELAARVNIRLNVNTNNKDTLEYGDVSLDLRKKVLINKDTKDEIEVLCKEYLLLECLLKNKGQVVSKEFIYNYVWGMDNDSISNNLEVYISFVRKKLKLLDSKVNIKAYRGLGYKLEVIE